MRKILILSLLPSIFLVFSCEQITVDINKFEKPDSGNTGDDTKETDDTNNVNDSDDNDTKYDADNVNDSEDSDAGDIDNNIYIDNTNQWGTESFDIAYSLAVDGSGNIFVVGYTEGAFDGNTNAGGSDIFLTKFNSDGSIAWTKQWGTSEDDRGYSVSVESSGNIYVAGSTYGALDGNTNTGRSDIFLTKFNSDGSIAWTKQWGTSESDYGRSVTVDSSGNIFVAGHTEGDLDANTNTGRSDIFLTKWNSDGSIAWTKQWGTSDSDFGNSLAIDSSDNIFVAGETYGSFDENTNAGDLDIFLTKWNADGTKAWTRQWGTSEDDRGYSVSVDSSGNIYVAGFTAGALDGNTSAGEYDAFLTKWNSDGAFAWTKQWGAMWKDVGCSVSVDSSDNIFVAGYTENTNLTDAFLSIFPAEE